MRLSTKSRYALRALVHLALNYKKGPQQIKNIAKEEKISVRYLENIFTKLCKAGILKSLKGKGGGFMLSKSPDKISLLDVINVLGEDTSLVKCVSSLSICKKSFVCVTRDVWLKLSKLIEEFLSSITLEQLSKNFKKKLISLK